VALKRRVISSMSSLSGGGVVAGGRQDSIEVQPPKPAVQKTAPEVAPKTPPNSPPNSPPKPAAAKPAAKKPGKRMSKADQLKASWSAPDQIRTNVSAALTSMIDGVKASGDDLAAHSIGEAHKLICGIPLPGLAFEYLVQNNVWPLGRVSQILGTEGSFKSQLTIEMARIFIEAAGGSWLGEHESKLSPDWVSSTIGWDREDSYKLEWCDSMDEWQQKLMSITAKNKRFMMGTKTEPGPGAVYPLLFVVDSIMGKAMQETQDRIVSAGSAGRDHPIEAKSLTSFMRTYPQSISRWPFHFMMVNHLRPKKVTGHGVTTVERDRAGGRGKEFQESFEIEMEKRGKISSVNFDGRYVQLKVFKNSMGMDGRSIIVPIRWWQEDDPNVEGGWRQVTKWDWNSATVALLGGEYGLTNEEKSRVKDVLDLHMPNKAKAYSKTLGIKPEQALPLEDVGRMIHENEEVMRGVRRALGVKMRTVFTAGTDYMEQLWRKKLDLAARQKMYRYGEKKKKDGDGE
jgi:hypothetical protein